MKLMTKELEKKFQSIGCQDGAADPVVIAKFFSPVGSQTWYATEYDPMNKIFFGYVSLFGDWNDEWGEFSLEELESIKLPMGLSIERDLYFEQTQISKLHIPSLEGN